MSDDFMDEEMLDIWDGLKEEPSVPQKNYPAKKRKKKPEKKKEAKVKKRFRIHYRFDGLQMQEIQTAYTADQAVTVFCKRADAWYIKAEIARKAQGFWVEEVKEEKIMGVLTKEQWDSLSYIKDSCYGNHDYPNGSGMVTYIASEKAKMRFEQFKTGNFLTIVNRDDEIHGSYKLNDYATALLFDNIFSQVGGIWFRREMPDPFCNYVVMAKTCLIAADIINGNMFNEENKKEESEMAEEKKMDLDKLVNEVNAQAEQVEEAIENNNAVEAQQVKENIDEKKEEEINMMDNENKKVEQVEVHEQQEPVIIENAVPVASIVLETIAGNDKQLSVALMPQDEKKGLLQAIRVTDGELENIGSYVLGGGYAFPLFRISSKWFKKVSLCVNRKVDTTNRTIRFSGSKNYMSLLKLMFSDEEIEQAKAQEISRRFPAICQRSESKGVPKNIKVSVILPDGNELKIDGWKQREFRPLFMENEDQSVTVRWDFNKGYKSPSIKYFGKMLRENHDGVSGNAEDAKVFKTIKEAIENALKG